MTRDEAIEILDRAFQEAYPDPADVFEDLMAEAAGVTRPEGLDLRDWRVQRAEVIEEAFPDGEIPESVMRRLEAEPLSL